MTHAAREGDLVTLHLTGTTGDGTVFTTTEGHEPLEVVLGSGILLPQLEEAITGLEPGEVGTLHLPAADAYGEATEATEFAISRETFHPDIELREGQLVEFQTDAGKTAAGTIVGWDEDVVLVEDRHPLAGEDVTFEFQVVSVEEGSA